MTPPLGDVFPNDIKTALAKENFRIGSVLKFFCSVAQKEKRFVYMGDKFDGQTIALVHINSEINENCFPTPELKSEHILLEKNATRPFLDRNSYVNCTQLILRTKEDIYNLIVKTPTVHLGQLTEDDYKEIKSKIRASRILKPAHKKEFGLFL